MALFSRGPKATGSGKNEAEPRGDETSPETPDADAAAAQDSAPLAPAPEGDAEPTPQVGISTTSYGGFGASATTPSPAPSGAPPAPAETIPGLPDNVVLRGQLATLGENPEPHEVLSVARQLLQGTVYLRVKGNAQELMSAGEALPLAIATREEGQFVMMYSSGAALAAAVEADGDTETSAMGQPAVGVLQYVLQGDFAGIMIDHASAPASVVLPRALIERMLEEWDPEGTLKKLVCGPRTERTAAEVADALTRVPLWIAVNRASDDDDWGVAESRTEAGERILPVFSHPLEVVALGRNDRPMPFTPAQLGQALRGDPGIDGIVVDAVGPWIRLDRDQLAPVMALPEPEPEHGIADEHEAGESAASPSGDDADED